MPWSQKTRYIAQRVTVTPRAHFTTPMPPRHPMEQEPTVEVFQSFVPVTAFSPVLLEPEFERPRERNLA